MLSHQFSFLMVERELQLLSMEEESKQLQLPPQEFSRRLQVLLNQEGQPVKERRYSFMMHTLQRQEGTGNRRKKGEMSVRSSKKLIGVQKV